MRHARSNRNSSGLSRRSCLATMGAGFSLPFFESVTRPVAASAPSEKPTASEKPTSSDARLVCLGVSLSMYPREWNPEQTGYDYKAPKLIEPLESLRDDFTLISNTDHPGVSGGHNGTAAFLSGVYEPEMVGQSIVIRNQVTFDQLAANNLNADTRYRSLQLAVAPLEQNDTISWNDKGVPLPAISDPLEVYRQLFVDDETPERTARALKQGQSVLDVMREEARALQTRLSGSDRNRFEQFQDSVRDVENGIRRELEWLATPKPGAPPVTQRPTSYHRNLDLQLELTALALQTDSTRVVSVGLPGKGMPIHVGNRKANGYHAESHHGKDPKVVDRLVEIELEHTRSLAKFLNRIKSIETDTGSLLDCTQVLFGSGLGNGSSHSNRDLPILLAGGGFKHGRHLKLDEGTPLSNLFVTMMQQMGLDTDSFAGSNGAIDELLG